MIVICSCQVLAKKKMKLNLHNLHHISDFWNYITYLLLIF